VELFLSLTKPLGGANLCCLRLQSDTSLHCETMCIVWCACLCPTLC